MILHFELLQLYRNYRNIENMKIDKEHSMVLGHFDRITVAQSNTADNALNYLYNHLMTKNRKFCADMQPMVLFSYQNYDIPYQKNLFNAVTFFQIKRPLNCKNIKDFFDYNVSSIKKVITELEEKGEIGKVIANVYVPFSFMNTAVIFYAENLTDICVVVKNIVHCKLADFQYSILSLPENPKMLSSITKNVNISLRFIWKEQVDADHAVNILKESVASFKNATVNHLLGNNDCLLHVPEAGYKIISMIISPKDKFKDFMSMVENTRATISFPENSIKLIELHNNITVPSEYIDISDVTIQKNEKKLIRSLNTLKRKAPELLKRDINDILYRVVEFSKFVKVINKHAEKGIAYPLYLSIKEPYELFLEMAADRVNKANSDQIDAVLEVIGNVVKEMSSYFGNIFHCNLGFIEERGFYNSIIGLASNVELAYNNYANCICDAILSKEERDKDGLRIRCSVTSDKEPLICTSDIFENTFTPKKEEKVLVKVNIPVSYVFKYDFVSKIIIHEIAHHVGARDREYRLKSICECFASVIADPIIQSAVFAITNSSSDLDKAIIASFEETEFYTELHNKMVIDIINILKNVISDSVISTSKQPYFMDDVIDSIYFAINNLPSDTLLINSLSEIITNFQYDYYEEFEDYFLQKMSQCSTNTNLLSELSGISIKTYNNEFVKYRLKYLLNYITTPSEADCYDTISQRICYFYIPELNDFIEYFCNAVSEAYCDLMMITLFDMSFETYMELMSEYGKTFDQIIRENDYFTWIRVNIIARYMNANIELKEDLPERFTYFEELKLYEIILPYFISLKSEFVDAYRRSQENSLLANFIKNISDNNEEQQLSEIFNMYYGITLNNKEGDINEK